MLDDSNPDRRGRPSMAVAGDPDAQHVEPMRRLVRGVDIDGVFRPSRSELLLEAAGRVSGCTLTSLVEGAGDGRARQAAMIAAMERCGVTRADWTKDIGRPRTDKGFDRALARQEGLDDELPALIAQEFHRLTAMERVRDALFGSRSG